MSDDLDRALRAARDWHAQGHGVAIATVIDTWGSAPRRRGAHLVVRDDGLFEGSVSGGCVEGDVLANAAEVIAVGKAHAALHQPAQSSQPPQTSVRPEPVEGRVAPPSGPRPSTGSGRTDSEVCSGEDAPLFRRLDYGVADATAWEVGLACGGKIAVLVQALGDAAFPPTLLDSIAAARAGGKSLALETDLATGRTRIGEDEGAFVNRYQPPLRMVIVGAVHISQALVPMARQMGFDVSVIDPRGSFAAAARFDVPVDERWPDEALAEAPPSAATAVVTLTHDPKLDDPALVAALRSPAFYIGSLGSRKTHAARLERMRVAGFREDDLARIKGPTGLDIGAANPAEIALSVMAQVVAAWRGKL